jgi:hypothetical protein
MKFEIKTIRTPRAREPPTPSTITRQFPSSPRSTNGLERFVGKQFSLSLSYLSRPGVHHQTHEQSSVNDRPGCGKSYMTGQSVCIRYMRKARGKAEREPNKPNRLVKKR